MKQKNGLQKHTWYLNSTFYTFPGWTPQGHGGHIHKRGLTREASEERVLASRPAKTHSTLRASPWIGRVADANQPTRLPTEDCPQHKRLQHVHLQPLHLRLSIQCFVPTDPRKATTIRYTSGAGRTMNGIHRQVQGRGGGNAANKEKKKTNLSDGKKSSQSKSQIESNQANLSQDIEAKAKPSQFGPSRAQPSQAELKEGCRRSGGAGTLYLLCSIPQDRASFSVVSAVAITVRARAGG